MDPAAYQAFEDALVAALRLRPAVLGLVAVGSFATGADRFSDHDFLVIAADDAAEGLRRDVRWLPHHDRLVLTFRETAHGVKGVYDDGHLVEFAVFTRDELPLAKLNRTRMLFDRADITARVDAVVRATEDDAAGRRTAEPDGWLVGQFLTALLVGVKRHQRGERLAGIEMVHGLALRHLLALLARHVPPERPELLDELDPFRRAEGAYPSLAAELDGLVATGDLARTAMGLLDLGERLVGGVEEGVAGARVWATIRAAIAG
jgi:predicted nucleotidyltransferase